MRTAFGRLGGDSEPRNGERVPASAKFYWLRRGEQGVCNAKTNCWASGIGQRLSGEGEFERGAVWVFSALGATN